MFSSRKYLSRGENEREQGSLQKKIKKFNTINKYFENKDFIMENKQHI